MAIDPRAVISSHTRVEGDQVITDTQITPDLGLSAGPVAASSMTPGSVRSFASDQVQGLPSLTPTEQLSIDLDQGTAQTSSGDATIEGMIAANPTLEAHLPEGTVQLANAEARSVDVDTGRAPVPPADQAEASFPTVHRRAVPD